MTTAPTVIMRPFTFGTEMPDWADAGSTASLNRMTSKLVVCTIWSVIGVVLTTVGGVTSVGFLIEPESMA